jgi:hypothetical protein
MPESLDQQDRVLTRDGARHIAGSNARVRHSWDQTPFAQFKRHHAFNPRRAAENASLVRSRGSPRAARN